MHKPLPPMSVSIFVSKVFPTEARDTATGRCCDGGECTEEKSRTEATHVHLHERWPMRTKFSSRNCTQKWPAYDTVPAGRTQRLLSWSRSLSLPAISFSPSQIVESSHRLPPSRSSRHRVTFEIEPHQVAIRTVPVNVVRPVLQRLQMRVASAHTLAAGQLHPPASLRLKQSSRILSTLPSSNASAPWPVRESSWPNDERS